MIVQAKRMRVNLHPRIPTSIGNRPTDHSAQPDRKATIVPTLAPARRNPAASGKLTYGPPGASPPATAPIKIPLNPDSPPTH